MAKLEITTYKSHKTTFDWFMTPEYCTFTKRTENIKAKREGKLNS